MRSIPECIMAHQQDTNDSL